MRFLVVTRSPLQCGGTRNVEASRHGVDHQVGIHPTHQPAAGSERAASLQTCPRSLRERRCVLSGPLCGPLITSGTDEHEASSCHHSQFNIAFNRLIASFDSSIILFRMPLA